MNSESSLKGSGRSVQEEIRGAVLVTLVAFEIEILHWNTRRVECYKTRDEKLGYLARYRPAGIFDSWCLLAVV